MDSLNFSLFCPMIYCNNWMQVLDFCKSYISECSAYIFSYFAYVDALRRAPHSFADLHYYSQVAYKFLGKSEKARLVRFRLMPVGESQESGLLGDSEQHKPWETGRHRTEPRGQPYSPHTNSSHNLKPITLQIMLIFFIPSSLISKIFLVLCIAYMSIGVPNETVSDFYFNTFEIWSGETCVKLCETSCPCCLKEIPYNVFYQNSLSD